MAIIINIDIVLAKWKMSVTELAEKVGITIYQLWKRFARRLRASPRILWNTDS